MTSTVTTKVNGKLFFLIFVVVLTSCLPAAKYEPGEADTLEQPQHQVEEVGDNSMQYTEDNTQYVEEDYGDYSTNQNYGETVGHEDSSKGKHEHISLQENDSGLYLGQQRSPPSSPLNWFY